MPKGQLTSDPQGMDVHLQANAQLHYGVNGAAGRNSRPGDEALQFLSPAEQECLQFFEETIDSLEESLEQDELRSQLMNPLESSSRRPVEEVDGPGPPTSSPKPGVTVSSFLARATSAKDHDIIDLVRPEPDLVQTKEPIFSPTNPDFQTMLPSPDSHFEIKPKRESMDALPSEYNPPLPSGSYGPDSLSSYHPPGCIPTPVLIAQKIAENQAGATSSIHPSMLLRRCSLESEKSSSQSADLLVKHGPPTSAKPTRFPANISVILGNKEHQNESLANVNIQERRAQMLANLTGTSHPLLQEDPQQAQKERNTPTRSVSFRDPTPDKSRMEALSKLGLTRNRAMSGDMSLPRNPLEPLRGAENSSKPVEDEGPPAAETSIKEPEISVMTPTPTHVDRKPEILQIDPPKIHDDWFPPPPAFVQRSYSPPPPLEIKPPVTPPSEVSSPEFNSYGGKSIVVHPPISSKGETTTSPTSPESKPLPPALANPSEFNTYGGKSKVLTPAPVAVTRSDLPDILSSHIDKSHTLPARSDPLPTDLNNYGGKSRTFNPSTKLNPPADGPARTSKAPAPTPAPRPPRHSYHGPISVPKAQRAPSPDHRRRHASMFRPQGITVQFSGRGATDESRREALRRLGLLKDS